MEILWLPPNYSEADAAALGEGRRMLAQLEAEYQARAAPIIEAMRDIEARYAPKPVLFDPKQRVPDRK